MCTMHATHVHVHLSGELPVAQEHPFSACRGVGISVLLSLMCCQCRRAMADDSAEAHNFAEHQAEISYERT